MQNEAKSPETLPQPIIALFEYYQAHERIRLIDYMETRTGNYLLIGYVEHTAKGGEEFRSFDIFRCDRHTGRKAGHIGTPVSELKRKDCSETWAYNAAKAIFKGI